ncbi:MAG TPA: S8 family serine peptidase, partial [Verrucomicrobiae bacterium]
MKTKLMLVTTLALAVLPLLKAAETPANGLSVRTRALSPAAAEQRMQAVDAGDFLITPKGPRKLLRWSGAVAVSTEEASREAVLGAVTGQGGALDGYVTHAKLGKGLAILKGPAAEAEQHRKSADALGQKIASARKAPGIRSANPVFIDPANGLWCVTTTDIIIHLKPGVNAPDYFGADWNRVRALSGTTDHFLLTLLTAEADAVLAESRRHGSDPRVQSSEPNFVMQVVKNSVPNDPLFASQWHLRNTGQGGGIANADVRAPQAWDITTGNPNVVIAVIDDGVQTTHPDLLPNIATNKLEIAGNNIDDDGNGYVDDVNGWNFYDHNNNPNPVAADDGHGTACAGIAVARGNNNTGGAGIAYTSRLMPVRLVGVGSVSLADIVESIYYAAGRTKNGLGTWRGADVISISLGFSQFSVTDNALTWAATNGRGGKGCPVFVATGNNAAGW